MYESPVNIIYGEMQTQIEGDVFKAIQNVGIDVNKEELIKALQYDRGQYEKGYSDGYTKAIDEFEERLKGKAEEILKNPDIMADCKKCTIWKVRDIEEITEQLKGEKQ